MRTSTIQILRTTLNRYADCAMPQYMMERCMKLIYTLPRNQQMRWFRKLEDCLRIEADEAAPMGFKVAASK